ncbi:hypothetical protein V6N00_13265 [Tersicoccus sp. MR15.9]|uniref:hypothetical protein n=1 Tax=Tersicoccus mangrovi TaxID=3121635 RepID=UPI002FE50DF4
MSARTGDRPAEDDGAADVLDALGDPARGRDLIAASLDHANTQRTRQETHRG